MAAQAKTSKRRCCRCNGSAKCLRCACVRAGSRCSHCLPGDSGNCRNTLPRDISVSPTPPPAPCAPPTTCLSSEHQDVTFTEASVRELPNLQSIFSTHIPTLHHVPKGARDSWAATLSSTLTSVVSSSSDISQWSKIFMLAKCVLASPATGHRLRWREILHLVKSRLKRWDDGDLTSLWRVAKPFPVDEGHLTSINTTSKEQHMPLKMASIAKL